ncbi:hypothetical protein PMZ80_006692 [Knufia obscura]|uniref:Uncharacterized protein n=1 Tax=Knufia obscura TaxID=1635080 RepID=A0ABR0RLC2_9EURO|nr:hypothetical protein PMZ80_006692 [Knufia obscura]
MSKEATNASKQEVRKDASDDGWEDERQVDVKEILKNAEITDRLLLALVNHPDFVGNNPPSSPKQLWNAADFCRRTYIEYALPILPQFCFYRSPRFVNRKILNYSRSYVINGGLLKIAEGAPTEEQDRWLEDPEN